MANGVYDTSLQYYNPASYATGPNVSGGGMQNPFFMPSGYNQQMSPIGSAITNMGQTMSPYGGYVSNYNFPQNTMGTPQMTGPSGPYGSIFPQGMDPRYFSQLYAPASLAGQGYQQQQGLAQQQYQLGQSATGAAIERIIPTLQQMGLPTGAADIKKFTDQQAALQSYPIQQEQEAAERQIREDFSRRGASLGSEGERLISESRGAAAGAMRQSAVGASLDYYLKLLQALPSLTGAFK